MNEWPENLNSLDLNWNLPKGAYLVFSIALLTALVLAAHGLAQATELPAVIVTESAGWIDFSGWFADGAAGGFDAAGAGASATGMW
jgi:hypothetical protein